jgi:hypothetical protein
MSTTTPPADKAASSVTLENVSLPDSYDKINQFKANGQWYTLMLGKAEEWLIWKKSNDK